MRNKVVVVPHKLGRKFQERDLISNPLKRLFKDTKPLKEAGRREARELFLSKVS